jgi:thiol:disulfide interchange protein
MFQQIEKIIGLSLILVMHSFAQISLSGLNFQKQQVKEPVTVSISVNKPESIDTVSISMTLHMAKNIHIYSAESLFFKLAIIDTHGLAHGSIEYPAAHVFTNFDKSLVEVYIDNQSFIIKHRITAPDWTFRGNIQFQACDSLMCFTPRKFVFTAAADGSHSVTTDTSGASIPQKADKRNDSDVLQELKGFTVQGSRGGFLNVEKFSAFLRDPSGGQSGGRSIFDNKGLFAIIILILIGGIALNLTPCVLPMIPVTIAVLGAGAQAKSRGRGMFVGTVYGFAMAITYGVLGLIVVLTGTRFGVINASPVFNLVIAAIFVVMALAMFDVIQIDFTRFRKAGVGGGERSKLATIFIMGIVASLLAGACVAPVVIAVVLYAGTLYANGNFAGLVLPFLLGVGMALPWPFAGAGLSLLPKPGKWMVGIKYVFGIFIGAMALYYAVTGIQILRSTASLEKDTVVISDETRGSRLPWITDLQEGLVAAQKEGKPVFVDFWATWCKNCKAMDATTFRHPDVEKLLGNYILVKYQAEHPDEPETKKMLNYFNIVGLPTYVVLKAR